ncbi:MAG: hypothetical protein ABSA83_05290 [Verrucomicrobiota bacterium]|jgi:hypothetical protein
MSDLSKVLRGLAVLALAAVLGTLIGWLVSRRGDVTPIAAPPPVSAPLAVAPLASQLAPEASPAGRETGQAKFSRHLEQSAGDWEQQLDDILLGEDDDNGKADRILALIPRAPAAAQQELAQHLVNMVQDDHYDGAAELLTNADTPPEVSGVLMNDLLNRNNSLKLPMLLAIARNSAHPLKDQALDLLGLLTQEDNGTNWDQWGTTIDNWLQENPQ